MITFLEGDGISAKIVQTIREADEYLILISPFIKFTDRIKSELTYLTNLKPDVQVEVIFGKNENKKEKSLSLADFNFLKELPNIRISYIKELHAKIYLSEDRLMLSSMNLHSYSQANNFEAGFVIEEGKNLISSLVNNSSSKAWDEALDFVNKIVAQSTCVYAKGKVYKSKFLGFSADLIEEYFEDNSEMHYRQKAVLVSAVLTGYCIRTKEQIPFDLKKPYTEKAFKSWQKFANSEYAEKYCHATGEASDGKTTCKNPILRKNWKDAKEKFRF